mgnify:CR=1 FL=1
MAAGIGSRFGGGIKQLAPVGLHGEIIMDYSIHDAMEAGFDKIIFIIRKDIEEAFREAIGERIEKICAKQGVEVAYAYQDREDLPTGVTCPAERTKPWGTGQAVLACREILHEPFAVINADDYYGKEGFKKVHDFLVEEHSQDDLLHFCMAGFILGNTLSENGGVTRGICQVDDRELLTSIVETHDITKTADGAGVPDGNGGFAPLDTNSHVSMNMWGFTPEILDYLDQDFAAFLSAQKEGDLKCEYLIPTVVDDMLKKQLADVQVLETRDRWFGVTYAEDKAYVTDSIQALVKGGIYPEKLFQ